MKLFNSMTKTIETFVPYNGPEVKMYTCGPTVYNYAHIGNLRTYIHEDILEKTLNYLGYDVKRVMNITDVGHMTDDADADRSALVGTLREVASKARQSDIRHGNNNPSVGLRRDRRAAPIVQLQPASRKVRASLAG